MIWSPGKIVEQEDGAEVHLRGQHQTEAVLLRPRERLLVREDHALAELGEAQQGQETAARARASVGPRERLFHEGEAGLGIAHDDPVLLPLPQLEGSPRVRVVALAVGGCGHTQVDAHDVVTTARVETRLEFRPDDVVGRCHQSLQVTRPFSMVPPGAKGNDGLHWSLLIRDGPFTAE